MAYLLSTVQWDSSAYTIHRSDPNAPNSNGGSVVWQTSDPLKHPKRVSIDQVDHRYAVASGENITLYSSDQGMSFAESAGTAPTTPVRKVLHLSNSDVVIVEEAGVHFSTNKGVSFVDVTPAGIVAGSPYLKFMDACEVGGTVYLLVSMMGPGGSKHSIYSSVAPLTTSSWAEFLDLSALGVPQGTGLYQAVPVRIKERGNSVNELVVMTTHGLYRVINLLTTPSGIDDHDATGQFLAITGMAVNPGWDTSGMTWRGSFMQELETWGDRIWAGASNGFRLHSFSPAPVFQATDPSAISMGQEARDAKYVHRTLDGYLLFTGSSYPQSTPSSFYPCLGKSHNGGVNVNSWSSFAPKDMVSDLDFWMDPPVGGCTDDRACNQNPDADFDDNSCLYTVKLTSCDSDKVLHSSSPSVVALGCKAERIYLDLGTITLPSGPRVVVLTLGGSIVANHVYQETDPATSPAAQIDKLIGGLIHGVNTGGPYRAGRVSPGDNPLVPGSSSGMYIELAGMSGSVQLTTQGLTGPQHSGVMPSEPGKVVKLFGQDGCWQVCGPGNCELGQELTVTEQYASCESCMPPLPTDPPAQCFDCSSMLVLTDGTQVPPSFGTKDSRCVAAGQELRVKVKAALPDQPQEVLQIMSFGCKETQDGDFATMQLLGDHTGELLPGLQVEAGEATQVVSASYDPGTLSTIVVTTAECGALTGDELTTYVNCSYFVRVNVYEVGPEGSEPVLLEDHLWNTTEGLVDQSLYWTVPQYGRYRIVVTAHECGVERSCTWELDACEQFNVVKRDCHLYQVGLSHGSGPVVTDPNLMRTFGVRILDHTGKVLMDTQVLENGFPFQVITPGDGYYEVEVSWGDEVVGRLSILDVCDIEACRRKLVLDLFCNDEPCEEKDPCKGSVKDLPKDKALRAQIARISLMLSELEALVHSFRYSSLGLAMPGGEIIPDEAAAIGDIIASLSRMSGDCGYCKEQYGNCN